MKRKVNTFHVFAAHQRKIVQQKNPGMSHKEVNKLLASQWKNMSTEEKTPYLKRPLNPFMIFAKERRKEMLEKVPYSRNREVSKMLAADWQKMTDEEKAPYVDKSQKEWSIRK